MGMVHVTGCPGNRPLAQLPDELQRCSSSAFRTERESGVFLCLRWCAQCTTALDVGASHAKCSVARIRRSMTRWLEKPLGCSAV